MTHELYKRTLLGGEVVRLLNTRIASSNHRLHTIAVNKKSLSGYDDKRFIMSDQVSMLPYGHRSIREDMFFKSIMNEPDWGADDSGESEQEIGQHAQESGQQEQETRQQASVAGQQALESEQQRQESQQQELESRQHQQQQYKNKQQTQQTTNIPHSNSILNTSLNSIPDPGFHQRNYSEDELNQNLVDFDNLSELSDSGSSTDPACDGFILSQAVESDTESQQVEQMALPDHRQNKNKRQNMRKARISKAKKRRAVIMDSSSEDE